MTSNSQGENSVIKDSKLINDNIPINEEDKPKSPSFLNKKTNRDEDNESNIIQPFYGNQCNICLEYDKYTLNKCIRCQSCKAECHLDCYKKLYPNELNESNHSITATANTFQCHRCKDSQLKDNDFHNVKCYVCCDSSGILMVDNTKIAKYVHWHCMSLIKEIREPKGEEREIKKWRTKETCRICKEKSNGSRLVIKCLNSKCKGYYHIPCAIKKGLLFALYFQYDFYGIEGEDKYAKVLPFYCDKHNKNLVKHYAEFTDQIDALIHHDEEEKDKEVIKGKDKGKDNDVIEEEDNKINEKGNKVIEDVSQSNKIEPTIIDDSPQKIKPIVNETAKVNSLDIKGSEEKKTAVPVVLNESPIKEIDMKGNEDINKRKTSICEDNPPKSSNTKSNNPNIPYVDPAFYNEFFFNSDIQ